MPFSLVILAGCDRAERRLVRFWPSKSRAVPSAPGVGLTRHLRMDAEEQPCHRDTSPGIPKGEIL